jgi:DNA-binding NtrC family response regulator
MRKVIIVDADEGICEFLTALLAEEGFQVSAACDTCQVLEQLRREEEAVVLLDLGFPYRGANMHAWLQQVQQLSRHQVIAMSASAPVAVGLQLLHESLITAFLPKPFDVEEMLAVVQQVAT